MHNLGPLESAVMALLWGADRPMSVRQVVDDLSERDPAYTTIATVLENLHRKEWVERDRVGRIWFYRPRIEASDHAALIMHEALAASDSPRATFLKFVDEISDSDAELLRELLAKNNSREQP